MTQIAVSLSGGFDSVTLLAYLVHEGYDVTAFMFDYGQRHICELGYAMDACGHFGIPYRRIAIGSLFDASLSSLTNRAKAVPTGTYAEQCGAGNLSTVVPGRNLLFTSVMLSHGFKHVALAVHANDCDFYADCRPDFIEALRGVARAYDATVHTPWLHFQKQDIALLNLLLDAPASYSCYNGVEPQCGQCPTCRERSDAVAWAMEQIQEKTEIYKTVKTLYLGENCHDK